MKEQPIDLPFPLKGINEDTALADLPPGYSASLLNVRPNDERTSRDRGAQRPGLIKYCPDQLGTTPIQELNVAVVSQGDAWSLGTGTSVARLTDSAITIWNAEGAPVASPATTRANNVQNVVDDGGNVYSVTDWTGSYTDPVVLTCYDATGAQVWQTTVTSDGLYSDVGGLCISAGIIYIKITEFSDPMTPGTNNTYIYRVSTAGVLLDAGAWLNTTLGGSFSSPGYNGNNEIAVGQATIGLFVWNLDDGVQFFTINFLILNKFTGVVLSTTLLATDGGFTGNYVLADVQSDDLDNYYLAWGIATTTPNTFQMLDATGAQVWKKTTSTQAWGIGYDRINSVLMVGGKAIDGGADQVAILNVADGTVSSGSSIISQPVLSIRPDGSGRWYIGQSTFITAIDTSFSTIWQQASSAIWGYQVEAGGGWNNRGIGLPVSRTVRPISVSGGNVLSFTANYKVAVSGGTGALSPIPPSIQSAQNANYLYFADGVNAKRYNIATNSMETWTASAGSLPIQGTNRPRLICTWRGRTVLGGISTDPYNYFMSKVNDPTDFDYGATPVSELIAIAGNNATAGSPPDILSSLVPWTADTLLMACDHSLWVMTGDPAAGGRIDMLTNTIGMVFGRPWTMDENGTLYFMSSRGSIYQLQKGGLPQKLSELIDNRLITLDLSQNIVELAWNDRWSQLHVFVTPLMATQASIHYLWDEKGGGWFLDEFANPLYNPRAAMVYDGDTAGDRRVLIGCGDGYVRMFEETADQDDGYDVDSYVFFGPIQVDGQSMVMLKELQCTMATGSGAVDWGTYSAESVQAALAASVGASGTFQAGRNRNQIPRRRGAAHFVKLSNVSPSKWWAFEHMQATIGVITGKASQRQF